MRYILSMIKNWLPEPSGNDIIRNITQAYGITDKLIEEINELYIRNITQAYSITDKLIEEINEF